MRCLDKRCGEGRSRSVECNLVLLRLEPVGTVAVGVEEDVTSVIDHLIDDLVGRGAQVHGEGVGAPDDDDAPLRGALNPALLLVGAEAPAEVGVVLEGEALAELTVDEPGDDVGGLRGCVSTPEGHAMGGHALDALVWIPHCVTDVTEDGVSRELGELGEGVGVLGVGGGGGHGVGGGRRGSVDEVYRAVLL